MFQALLQDLGVRFRELREKQDLPQREVARRAGTVQYKISDLENAKSDIRIGTLVRLADAINHDVEIIFTALDPEDNWNAHFNEALNSIFGSREQP